MLVFFPFLIKKGNISAVFKTDEPKKLGNKMKINKGYVLGAGVSLTLAIMSWPIAKYILNASVQELSVSYWIAMAVVHLSLYGVYTMVEHAYNVLGYDIDAADVLKGGIFVVAFILSTHMNYLAIVVGQFSETGVQVVRIAYGLSTALLIYVLYRACNELLD
jgi:hypothetical protein